MSAPVSVKVNVVNILTFEKACIQAGQKVERIMKGDVLTGIKVNPGNYTQNAKVEYDEVSQTYKCTADDMWVAGFQSKVMSLYNALQIKETLESQGDYKFADNWLEAHKDGGYVVNAVHVEG